MEDHKKRKRAITACVECYRRKQKCDRKQPCQICTARDVTCSYVDSSYGPPQPQPSSKKIRYDEDDLFRPPSSPRDLSHQIGYSHSKESDALKVLDKPLRNQDVTTPKSLLVKYLKDKFSTTIVLLPEPKTKSELINVFFVEANSHIGVLDQYFFHKAESAWNSVSDALSNCLKIEGIPRDVLYFPAVLFQVLAVSLQYLTLDSPAAKLLHLDNYEEIDELSLSYTHYGMDIMKLLGRHSPTVMSVQHDLMRAFWLKNCSCGTESWYILGDAIRQAQILGLHLQSDVVDVGNVEKTLENLWYDEWKKRLWVSLFNWDAHMALVLGRPRTINASDCTVERPLDCNMPVSPPTTVPINATLSRIPSSYTRHIFNNFISHKVHEMLCLGANRRYVKDYGIVKRLQDDVLRNLEDLPPTSRPNNPDTSWDSAYPYLPRQREHILTHAHSFLVALHRPHATAHEESRRVAISSSLATLEAQQRLFAWTPHSHHRSFGISFYTIDASLFLSTVFLEHPIDDLSLFARVDAALSQAIDRLNIVKSRNPMAQSAVKVLERCYDKIRATAKCPVSSVQETPSLISDRTTQSAEPQKMVGNGIPHDAPDYSDFDWAFSPNGNQTTLEFDLVGNVTDFNASFWTDQMTSILDANAVGSDEATWPFLTT